MIKPGDLVKSAKFKNSIGIVIEVFRDLDVKDPWIRVRYTHPVETYQWVKRSGLILMPEEKEGDR